MNDFTIQELQAIYWCVNPVRINSELCDIIKNKLQSMIENYSSCNHESDGLIYTSHPPQNKCKKCGEFYR